MLDARTVATLERKLAKLRSTIAAEIQSKRRRRRDGYGIGRNQYRDKEELRAAIAGFAYQLVRIDSARHELNRRASIIETRCKKDTPYSAAMTKVVDSFQNQADEVRCHLVRALAFQDGIPFRSTIEEERQEILRFLARTDHSIRKCDRSNLLDALAACDEVLHYTDQQGVDGSYYINDVYAHTFERPEALPVGSILLELGLSSRVLAEIGEAATTLVKWLIGKPRPDSVDAEAAANSEEHRVNEVSLSLYEEHFKPKYRHFGHTNLSYEFFIQWVRDNCESKDTPGHSEFMETVGEIPIEMIHDEFKAFSVEGLRTHFNTLRQARRRKKK